jgi:hypothetical protein
MFRKCCLYLTVILLICFLVMPVIGEGTVTKSGTIFFNITSPQEDDVFYYDVVPAYLSVRGTVSGSEDIRNVTVTYGNESVECGKKHEGYFDISCDFLINPSIKKITIIVMDSRGLETSETRNFTSYMGPPPPETIYVYGKVVDPDGKPISGALLTFQTEIEGYGLFSVNTTTDSSGKFSMKKTFGYHQKITVEKSGYITIVQEKIFKPYDNDSNFTLHSRIPVMAEGNLSTIEKEQNSVMNNNYWIKIEPVGDIAYGDNVPVTAYTNIPIGEEILAETTVAGLTTCPKSGCDYPDLIFNITVTRGDGTRNKTIFELNASAFRPNQYLINERSLSRNVSDQLYFNILEASKIPHPSATPDLEVIKASPSVTKSPIFFVWTFLAVFVACFILIIRRKGI